MTSSVCTVTTCVMSFRQAECQHNRKSPPVFIQRAPCSAAAVAKAQQLPHTAWSVTTPPPPVPTQLTVLGKEAAWLCASCCSKCLPPESKPLLGLSCLGSMMLSNSSCSANHSCHEIVMQQHRLFGLPFGSLLPTRQHFAISHFSTSNCFVVSGQASSADTDGRFVC